MAHVTANVAHTVQQQLPARQDSGSSRRTADLVTVTSSFTEIDHGFNRWVTSRFASK